MIHKLYLRRLQKLYEREKRFKKFVKSYNNFILDVDTTGPSFKKNVQILPNFLAEFDRIVSVQIYTPYEIWLNRILERKIHSSLKGSKSIRRVLHKSFSLKPFERNQAQNTYDSYYTSWETTLKNYNIKAQLRIDTTQDLILE